jgi:hypothetical protein
MINLYSQPSCSRHPPSICIRLVPIIVLAVCGGIVPLHTKSATELRDNTRTLSVCQPYT